jgi:phosphomannomutase
LARRSCGRQIAATGQPLSALVAELPRYASVKQKAELPRERIDAAVAAVATAFADRKPNTADGVRVDFPAGWVHLRASNTEPIVRVVAEATTAAEAERLVAQVRAAAGI